MKPCFVVAGTGTDVGKTVLAAALAGALDGCYWKPVQCGLSGETDAEIVRRLSGLPAERILPEAYRLGTPASPHQAAERDGVEIDVERLARSVTTGSLAGGRPSGSDTLDTGGRPLVIEAAGGLMVPLTRRFLQIDLLARWGVPVVLCAQTRLGTINHSLLSIEALKRRAIPLLGVAFIGEEQADSERTIADMGGVRRLGRLPHLDPLDAATLRSAFDRHFRRADFLADAAI
jgi:dethiobiotin synthetase